MSTPPYLDLPSGARRVALPTARGPLAGVVVEPEQEAVGTVLLVPGWTGSKEDFIAVLAPLAERGWRVVSYDQRGQFESAGPDDEAAYSLEALAQDLLEVADAWDDVHVVGHSFGGLVAREAALLPSSGLQSLTLLCSGPSGLPEGQLEGLRALHTALPAAPLEMVWQVKVAGDRANGWVPPTPEVEEFMHRRFISNNPWGLRAKTAILLATPDRTDELAARAGTGFPVGVVYGPHDDAWPTSLQDAVASAVGTTACVVPDCGHSPAAEKPEETAEALDTLLRGFLARARG